MHTIFTPTEKGKESPPPGHIRLQSASERPPRGETILKVCEWEKRRAGKAAAQICRGAHTPPQVNSECEKIGLRRSALSPCFSSSAFHHRFPRTRAQLSQECRRAAAASQVKRARRGGGGALSSSQEGGRPLCLSFGVGSGERESGRMTFARSLREGSKKIQHNTTTTATVEQTQVYPPPVCHTE